MKLLGDLPMADQKSEIGNSRTIVVTLADYQSGFVNAVDNPISRSVGRALNCAVRTYQTNLILFKDIHDRGSPVQIDPQINVWASDVRYFPFEFSLKVPQSYVPEGVPLYEVKSISRSNS